MQRRSSNSILFGGRVNWLLLSCSFSCVLLLGRILIKGDDTYAFLFWNLYLAIVPFMISRRLLNARAEKAGWRQKLLIALWLLFIPNSFYILTDLLHFRNITSAPEWFDLLLLFSFSWNGLLLGVVSLRNMELYSQRVIGRTFSLAVIGAVMWLNAWGIYIGRFLRYNSWDVIVRPFSLFGDMLQMACNPFDNRMEWAMICCYAIFMALLYVTVTRLSYLFLEDQAHSIKS